MLVVVSPAKRLDWSPVQIEPSHPAFQADAARLAGHARQLTLGKLKALMGLSDDLARLNRDRFQAFAADPAADTLKPALYAFAGDTYLGFNAESLSAEGQCYANAHLRILSGLYGLLRPSDGIQPYRLEMGSRLKTRRGTSLYDYWGDQISRALNAQAEKTDSQTLVNCASQEYFGAVDRKRLKLDVVTPEFYEIRDGRSKMISFFAKRARGAFARFIVDTEAKTLDDLKAFARDGYHLDETQVGQGKLVFTRETVPA